VIWIFHFWTEDLRTSTSISSTNQRADNEKSSDVVQGAFFAPETRLNSSTVYGRIIFLENGSGITGNSVTNIVIGGINARLETQWVFCEFATRLRQCGAFGWLGVG